MASSYVMGPATSVPYWTRTGTFSKMVYDEAELRDTVVGFTESVSVSVSYQESAGATSKEYTGITLSKKYKLKPDRNITAMPYSFHGTLDGDVIVDRDGKIYKDIGGSVDSPVMIGTINYTDRTVEITDDDYSSTSATLPIQVTHLTGRSVSEPTTGFKFKTPGAPVRSGSVQVKCTSADGTTYTGTADFNGNIETDYMNGFVSFQTGYGWVEMGSLVADSPDYADMDWYDVSNVSEGQVWKPIVVLWDTVLINCVMTSYLPLDEGLLGLNPVRLPLDGKVPIFRDGEIVLIHNTLSTTIPANPAVAGATYSIGRTNVSLIEVYDQNEVYIPDTNYTVDLVLGTVTMDDPLDLTQPGPYTPVQPLIMMHRIEDMALASDVQITGHIGIISPLTHDYPATTSFVSSVMPLGDLQARAYNEFEQTSWPSVWSDTMIGTQPIASFDLINFPILVENNSSTQERFACIFQNTTTVQIVGEHLGVLKNGGGTTFSIIGGNAEGGDNIAPLNTITGQPYFTITAAGWGAGWASNLWHIA